MKSIIYFRSLGIRLTEFEYQASRGSGPGGQNVNKVNSRMTLRWRLLDSGMSESIRWRFKQKFGNKLTAAGELLISSDRFRDQLQNKLECERRLEVMLREVEKPPKRRVATKVSKNQKTKRVATKRIRSAAKQQRRKPEGDD